MEQFPAENMDRVAADFDGRIGFYAEDLASGQHYQYNAEERLPTASVCKVPVMVELFRQAEAGELSLDQRRLLEDKYSTHGSGTLSLAQDQPELSLRDYCRFMIAISDNMATDLLMEIVGLDRVNQTMEVMGYGNIRTNSTIGQYHYAMVGLAELPRNRKNDQLMADKRRAEGLDYSSSSYRDHPANNVASAAEMGQLIKGIHNGAVVSAPASAAMLDLLRLGAGRTMVPRYLLPNVEVAHKYGSSGRIKGDAAVVFLPEGPMVIAAFALAANDGADGAEVIARLSRLAVGALAPGCVAKI